jgi:hypothetical protein
MVMHYLLGGTGLYHRLDPLLPTQIALDDVNAMKNMQAFAETVDMTETLKFVDENFSYDSLSCASDAGSYNAIDSSSDYHSAWMQTKDKDEGGAQRKKDGETAVP